MNLVIDIGNTLTKIAVFDADALVEVYTQPGQSPEEIKRVFSLYKIEQIIVASVVELTPETKQVLQTFTVPVLFLQSDTPIPVENLYETPQTLGYDRIAAVVAANREYPGRDILVIDIGTAITYDFADSRNRYRGGNISPGMRMRFKALNHYTGKLPLVEKEGELPPLGKSTETAIRSGVMKGIEYEINGYITSLKHKYPELLVFLTGGDANSFAANIKNIIFADSFLVLKGLNRILNYNNGRI